MVETRKCSFCGMDIEPGTGRLYVTNDGNPHFFCSSKCYKNSIVLKRNPKNFKWTRK